VTLLGFFFLSGLAEMGTDPLKTTAPAISSNPEAILPNPRVFTSQFAGKFLSSSSELYRSIVHNLLSVETQNLMPAIIGGLFQNICYGAYARYVLVAFIVRHRTAFSSHGVRETLIHVNLIFTILVWQVRVAHGWQFHIALVLTNLI
jgi:hypothetical protein